jgi:predicted O-methyltransferase YrrM
VQRLLPPIGRVRVAARDFLTNARPARDPEARRIREWVWGSAPRVTIAAAFPGIEDVDVKIRRAFNRPADGCSIDAYEIFCICAIERLTRASNVLEIGTYDGNTALNLAANVGEGGRVVTVDLPTDWDGSLGITVPDRFLNVGPRDNVGAQYEGTPEAGTIEQVFADTATLDWARLGGPFDLIFIDGCHHSDYVRKDTENALAQLAPNGVLIWHDYGMSRHVSRVVDEIAIHRRVNALRGTRLAVTPGSA